MQNNNNRTYLKNRFELNIRAFNDMVIEDKYNAKTRKLRLTYPKAELSLFISVPVERVSIVGDRTNVLLSGNDTYWVVEYRKQIKQEGKRLSGASLIALICDYEEREFYATTGQSFIESRQKAYTNNK